MPQSIPASTSTAEAAGAEAARLKSARLRAVLRPWLTVKAVSAIVVLTVFIAFALFAPFLVPFDPNRQNLLMALTPPQYFDGPHFLGTDHVGRDILSRIIYGARISLLIAVAVVVFSGIVGIVLGLVSGYFGGWVDFAIQKLLEVFWAFPPLLLAITIVAFFGQGLAVLIVALAIQRWIPYCRVARANTLSLKEHEFVMAARSLGAGHTRIVARHIAPNLMQSALIIGTFAMATAILAEAALSFPASACRPTFPPGARCCPMRAPISRHRGGCRCFRACASS